MRDICRAADITPPTIYYYFRNKVALFDAVVRQTISMTDFIARLNDECEKAQKIDSKIGTFIRIYLSQFPEDQLNVGLYVRNSTELDAVGRKTLTAELAQIESILAHIIRDGVAKREFRQTDPRMAAECLLGMMNRFVFQQIHFQRSYKPLEAASYLTEFFLLSMRRTE
jgi:AcrR family transcriptional regulator